MARVGSVLTSSLLPAVVVFAGTVLRSQGMPYLVRDIVPGQDTGNPGSDPWFVTPAGRFVFFTARTAIGRELWRTDGTAAGTILLRDIHADWTAAGPEPLGTRAGVLFFSADDGATGRELWCSDGTVAGTRMVKDVNPRPWGSAPGALVELNGAHYFLASNGNGFQLWRTTGTTDGTVAVADPAPGYGSNAAYLTRAGNTLFFRFDDGVHGHELWMSDGRAAGTAMVLDLSPGPGSSHPSRLVEGGGRVWFTADDGTRGYGLWITDGTGAGTQRLADLYPTQSTFWNGLLWFIARDGTHGEEIWVSDGTAAGTRLLKDVNPGYLDGAVGGLVPCAGAMFFVAREGPRLDPFSLWRSDGTTAGTTRVRLFTPGPSQLGPAFLTAHGNQLFFRGSTPEYGDELWSSDGTPAGTVMAVDIVPGPSGSNLLDLTSDGTWLWFTADDGRTGRELWRSDSTAAGTTRVLDLAPPAPHVSAPQGLTPLGETGTVLFAASDLAHGQELWRSDGTATGTALVMDIRPGIDASLPMGLTDVAGRVFFTAHDGVHGWALWCSDGTAAGTSQLSLVSPALPGPTNPMIAFGRLLLFAGYESRGTELWTSDGTAAGTMLVKDINPLPNVGSDPGYFTLAGDVVFFTARDDTHGTELWRTDGTAAGTVLVKDINPGPESAYVGELTAIGRTLFFIAIDAPNTGPRLWATDGTSAGTRLLGPPVPMTWGPSGLRRVGDELLFFVDQAPRTSLWRSDGTVSGTVMVAFLGDTPVVDPTVMGRRLLFGAFTPEVGMEPWVSDGTPERTGLLADLLPGAESSLPVATSHRSWGGVFAPAGADRALFLAHDGRSGFELWVTDGTLAGTHLHHELTPGAASPWIGRPVRGGRRLFFAADDGTHGAELWAMDSMAAAPSLGLACAAIGAPLPELNNESGAPFLGNAAFTLLVQSASPGVIVIVPVGLAPAWLPLTDRCLLHVDPASTLAILVAFADGGGHAFVPLPVPFDATLAGSEAIVQALTLDPRHSWPDALATSRALALVLAAR